MKPESYKKIYSSTFIFKGALEILELLGVVIFQKYLHRLGTPLLSVNGKLNLENLHKYNLTITESVPD